MIGIVPDLRGKIESNAQSGLALFEEIFIPLIGFLCGGKSCILTHRPETAPVHGRLDPPGKRVFSGESQITAVIGVRNIQRGIETLQLDVGSSLKNRLPFRRFGENLIEGYLLPALQFFSKVFTHD
jgi:hypothetical protein